MIKTYRPLLYCILSLLFTLCLLELNAQIPVRFDQFIKNGGIQAEHENDLLRISWGAGEDKKCYLSINLKKNAPLIERIEMEEGEEIKEIAAQLDPAFLVTVGK